MGALRALGRAPPQVRRWAVEAIVLLPLAAAAIRAAPFPRAIALGAVPLGKARPVDVDLLSRTIERVADRMPFRARCFEQGLTVQRMLRRRGAPAILHYGINPRGALSAHVWVTLEGRIVHGADGVEEVTEVGQWP